MLKTQISTLEKYGIQNDDPDKGVVLRKSDPIRNLRLPQEIKNVNMELQNSMSDLLAGNLALLETARFGFVCSSGKSAIHTILKLFSSGDHIICSHDFYKGTFQIVEGEITNINLSVTFLDASDFSSIEHGINSSTKAIFVETPSNPMMKVTDLSKVSSLAKSLGLILIVDNTALTPNFQRPVELGANIVIHTGTKFLCGCDDTQGGFVVTDDEKLAEKIKIIREEDGALLSSLPRELYLCDLKGLEPRMNLIQSNAMRLAEWLRQHPKVHRVYYTGLPDHPGHLLMKYQTSGYGGLVSFTVKEPSLITQILEKIKVITLDGYSGGIEDLVIDPIQTKLNTLEETRESNSQRETLLRISTGTEDIAELISDLKNAMDG